MRSISTASAALAVTILISACGSSGATATASPGVAAATCDKARGAHHAWLVVEHGNGSSLRRCVGFETPTVTALDLTQRARIEVGTQRFSFGVAICQVDGEPAHYSQCLPSGAPYWALFQAVHGGSWKAAAVAASSLTLRDGDVAGWRYDSSSAASPAPPDPAP